MAHLANPFTGDDEDCREFATPRQPVPPPTVAQKRAALLDRRAAMAAWGNTDLVARLDAALAALEPGDFVVCACGQLHEADYCPTAAGHGAVL